MVRSLKRIFLRRFHGWNIVEQVKNNTHNFFSFFLLLMNYTRNHHQHHPDAYIYRSKRRRRHPSSHLPEVLASDLNESTRSQLIKEKQHFFCTVAKRYDDSVIFVVSKKIKIKYRNYLYYTHETYIFLQYFGAARRKIHILYLVNKTWLFIIVSHSKVSTMKINNGQRASVEHSTVSKPARVRERDRRPDRTDVKQWNETEKNRLGENCKLREIYLSNSFIVIFNIFYKCNFMLIQSVLSFHRKCYESQRDRPLYVSWTRERDTHMEDPKEPLERDRRKRSESIMNARSDI